MVLARHRVAFVDDDGFVLRALEIGFAGEFDLYSLHPSPDIVAKIMRISPIVVITDWDLRSRTRDGVWLLGSIKREGLRARRVLMTGHPLAGLPPKARHVADLILRKPFGRSALDPILSSKDAANGNTHADLLAIASRDRNFVEHLVDTGLIEREQLLVAMDRTLATRKPIGGIAIEMGLMTPKQVFEVLREQGTGDERRRFGELAMDRGYLNQRSLAQVLQAQCDRTTPVLVALAASKTVQVPAVEHAWRRWAGASRGLCAASGSLR